MKIDIHTHIMPEKMPNWTQKFGYGEFIHLEHRECDACMMKGDKVFRVVEKNSFDETERLMARLKMAELPRNANPTRVRNRCATTGRPRA